MATLQGKAVKNTYRQVLQIGANNVGVSGTLQQVQDGSGAATALSLSTGAATVTGDLTITGDLIITGGGLQIKDLIDDTVADLIQDGTGITWAYDDTLATLTPNVTIATADGGVQGDYVQFNTAAAEASAVGKLKWNTTDGTLDLGLMGGQVTLQIGQEQVARVVNNSGTILTEAGYQVVKIASAQGQRLAVNLAQANNDANSVDTLGLVTENIANNQEGYITTSGLVRGIDTTGDLQLEDWNDGDVLYLSPFVPGKITKVKPTAPNHTVTIGYVVYAHKNNGQIFVKVDNGYEIDELHNVRITNVADNNILQYNSSLSVWENVAGTTTNVAEGTNLYYTQGRFDSAFAAKSTTNLPEGTNLYFTETRATNNFDTNLAASTTTDLAEGTNLYYTNTRARLALDVTAGTGISYNNGTGVFALGSIPNSSLTNSSLTINSQSVSLGGSVTLTTSNIAEGTNLYWTNERFDARLSTKTTTDLAEGTNLYYTQTRFNNAFAAKSTTDLAEGTNLYYTDARSRAAFSENAVGLDYTAGSGVLSLTAGYAIPTTVKLGEYDIAYNRSVVSAAVTGTDTKTLTLTQQDANTITATWTDKGIDTINGTTNQIAANTVGNTTTIGFVNDVTFPNNVVVSGNLTINGTATYVNTEAISSKDPLFEVANTNNTTDAVDIGYYGRYFDAAQERVEFTGLFRDASDAGKFKFFTGLVDEPTNVVNTTGVGYTAGTLVANIEGNLAGTANAANQLSTARTIAASGDATWSVSFDGTTNVSSALTLADSGVTASTYGTSTSVPTIAVDGKGRITSASNTNIAFPVTTVNSQSGNVVLTTSNVAEGTNQYFTTGRVSAYLTGAISTILTTDLTASRALVSDGSGKIIASASATATEVSYLAGVTSAIQTQLNTKLDSTTGVTISTSQTISGVKTFSNEITIDKAAAALNIKGSSFGNSGAVLNLYGWNSVGKNWQINTGTTSNTGLLFFPTTTAGGTTFSTTAVMTLSEAGELGTLSNISAGGNIYAQGFFFNSMPQGSVLFAGASKQITQNQAKLFWDDTNYRLGINTISPSKALDVNSGDIRLTTGYTLQWGGTSNYIFADTTTSSFHVYTNGSQKLTVNTTGIGVYGTPTQRLHVFGGAGGILLLEGSNNSMRINCSGTGEGYFQVTSNSVNTFFAGSAGSWEGSASQQAGIGTASTNINFYTAGSATARVNMSYGTRLNVSGMQTGQYALSVNGANGSNGMYVNQSNSAWNTVYNGGASTVDTVITVGKDASTARSINAGGTINASGADYAEYMVKAITDIIAKGEIVGVNEDGKLTNIYSDAKSFVVKSTDPAYVGGDVWSNYEITGEKPRKDEEQTDEEFEVIMNNWLAKLEIERAKVDRIAFSGQVPCNVLGASVGDYIIPIELNGKISGQAVTNPTFEQYQKSVGKVWKIMEDGRAWIAVKIG